MPAYKTGKRTQQYSLEFKKKPCCGAMNRTEA